MQGPNQTCFLTLRVSFPAREIYLSIYINIYALCSLTDRLIIKLLIDAHQSDESSQKKRIRPLSLIVPENKTDGQNISQNRCPCFYFELEYMFNKILAMLERFYKIFQ